VRSPMQNLIVGDRQNLRQVLRHGRADIHACAPCARCDAASNSRV
jgi:hypothetical protein